MSIFRNTIFVYHTFPYSFYILFNFTIILEFSLRFMIEAVNERNAGGNVIKYYVFASHGFKLLKIRKRQRKQTRNYRWVKNEIGAKGYVLNEKQLFQTGKCRNYLGRFNILRRAEEFQTKFKLNSPPPTPLRMSTFLTLQRVLN